MKRVWIYQADRFLSDEEVAHIEQLAQEFVGSWTAHGSALDGKASMRHNLFLILEVDEEQAGVTGCSIDKSVHFVKKLESLFGVGFFDRMKVAFEDTDNSIKLVSRTEFADLVKSGIVSPGTKVFNNVVQTAEELASNWYIDFKDSWHSKVFGVSQA